MFVGLGLGLGLGLGGLVESVVLVVDISARDIAFAIIIDASVVVLIALFNILGVLDVKSTNLHNASNNFVVAL